MIFYLILSFLLDGVLSNYLVVPLFTLCAIILMHNHPVKYQNHLVFIIGLLYDIVYTNTLFFHAAFFTLITIFFRTIITKYKIENFQSIILIIIGVLLYQISSYIYSVALYNLGWSISLFIKWTLYALIINVLYALISLFLYDLKKRTSKYYS